MKNVKKGIIFILINVIVLAFVVVIPAIPAKKFYNANHFITPSNTSAQIGDKTGPVAFVNIRTLANNLQNEELKNALSNVLTIFTNESPKISLKNASLCYFLLGTMVGIVIIAMGIILRYKSKNHVFGNAFIFSGVITVVYYIHIFALICNNYILLNYSNYF